MEITLIILGSILMLLGIVGCIIPVIPGPPLSYIGILMLHFTDKAQFSTKFLIFWAAVAVIVTILDYVVPAWGTKKFGGSRRGVWGSIIGLILGIIFFPPLGIIIGPFAGAVIGEMTGGKKSSEALRSGFGSFIGLLVGVLLKLIVSGWLTWYFVVELF